ncbi:MAG: TorF family putative porin [Arenimonas sp.]|nr:TorF family putative porin [Arenimonas sp.]
MKNTTPLSLALAAALLAVPMTGFAQDAAEEDDSGFSWNAAITSDYMFRGVSQTQEDPAFQLGADYSFAGGFYVGAWASNVDFGAGGPDVEVDTYIGWNTDLSDAWNLDLMLNRYNYIGQEDYFGDGEYTEFLATVAYDETYSFTFGYTNDIYDLDQDAFYAGAGGEWDIGKGFALGAGVGYNVFDDSTGFEDYLDYSVSLSRDIGPVNASLSYVGTNDKGEYNFGDNAEDRVVLTFSIEG